MYDVETLAADPVLFEPFRRSVEQGAAPAYLRSVKIKLTARCNLKCVMCRYGRGWAPPELGTERFATILDELAAMGCRKVHFSGGEVLSRSDFEDLAARAADVGMKVTLTSNLTLLTRERAKRLAHVRISSLSTSLDGASAKVHDAVRGIPGSFRRTLRALALVARHKKRDTPRVRVNFVMMRRNFEDYPALVALAHELGAVDVVPMPVDSKRTELRLSKRLIRHYNDEIAPRVVEARERAGYSLDPLRVHPFGATDAEIAESAEGRYAARYYERAPCYAPFLHMFIAWDGKVYLCCMTNGRIEPLGDLARQSVAEVFCGEAFQRMRAQMLVERLPACHACDMYLPENATLGRALAVVR
jgi:MoaA/NifB/PqqE/SkfB family radical SAM enzyme